MTLQAECLGNREVIVIQLLLTVDLRQFTTSYFIFLTFTFKIMNIAPSLRRALPRLRHLRSTQIITMSISQSQSQSLYTSVSLKAANAPTFSTLKGKLDPSLLEGLDAMGFDYMTPVQRQILSPLPGLPGPLYKQD